MEHDFERIFRRRQADIVDSFVEPIASDSSIAMLMQVFSITTLPSGPDKFYACHPIQSIGGVEGEGVMPTFVAGASTEFVAVIDGTPAVGDILLARRISGRWIARKRGGTSGCGAGSQIKFHVEKCSFGADHYPYAGVPITVYAGSTATGTPIANLTTDATGEALMPITAAGTYCWTFPAANHVTGFTGTIVAPCGGTTTASTNVGADTGYFCCKGDVFPIADVTMTYGCGTLTLIYQGGCTWTGSGADCAGYGGTDDFQLDYLGGGHYRLGIVGCGINVCQGLAAGSVGPMNVEFLASDFNCGFLVDPFTGTVTPYIGPCLAVEAPFTCTQ